ncbi:MAG: UDP-N-acetylmuramoyl-L-alanyl-D-glutamate--2,6-diaminopimelate ligase [Thiotrichaceae bacterium]|nr:UDP-N-acetylmuramoyl-L-alanyl-D-glutamate--2,6-diaminopimelate ligase [Thiotrichaceae bacterium]
MKNINLVDLLVDIIDLPSEFEAILVSQLTLDSREVTKGGVFIALQGEAEHGVEYAEKADEHGAVAILLEDKQCFVSLSTPCFTIPNLRKHLGTLANRFYGAPSESISVIGVTGTDGKSTVSHFIADALNHLGKKSAVIGTLGVGIPGTLVSTGLTTPDVLTVHRLLAELKAEGVETVIMEVSSHALDQGRVDGVKFETALLTNLGRDHLDYHHDLATYRDAKAKLFSRSELQHIVVNAEDDFGKILFNQYRKTSIDTTSFSSTTDDSHSIVSAQNASYTPNGIEAEIVYQAKSYPIKVSVIGEFNLENILATMAVLLTMNLSIEQVLDSLSAIKTVPGRMERVNNEQGILVVVDYAHTAGALMAALSAVKAHTSNRILCVFGCGGDRDKGKRPLMARVAEENAQMVVLTDDNPRSEMPFQIIHDMIEGLEHPEHVAVEHDRAKAIHFAIQSASHGDSVLIAGKGHETTQLIAGITHPFSDYEQAMLALAERET